MESQKEPTHPAPRVSASQQTILGSSGAFGAAASNDPPMSAAAVCDLYELTDSQNSDGHPNVFVLGTLSARSERIAVISQQTRAVNLIHCLFATGRLAAGKRVCVVGGGAAGLTAAAYAMQKGAEVTVLERNDLLWNLRGCRTRWLHPNLFRYWPDPRWKCVGTHLPLMNWYAGYACDVGELLLSKYRAFEASQSSRKNLRISFPGQQTARDTRVEPRGECWKVSWSEPEGVGRSRREAEFDAIIVATGFGSEARLRDTEASVYWLDDVLERERPEPRERRYLVSGTGDGGLTDLLRIRIKGFRHHHLREWLLQLELGHHTLVTDIEQIERKARAGTGYDPTEAYLQLARECRFGPFLDHLRAENSAVLTHAEPGKALFCPAWSISRFLAAQLLQHDPLGTGFHRGPVTWEAVESGGPASDLPIHPERFSVRFGDGLNETVDAIVTRHGPEKARDPVWGDAPVRSSLDLLRRMGFEPPVIRAAESKWADASKTRKVTDELFAALQNVEGGLRSRAQFVLPPVSGRTVIGMLSRLVANVRPEHKADRAQSILDIHSPLVSDDTAALLDPVGDRILLAKATTGALELEYHGGWHMGREIDRRAAIEAISAADRWFSLHGQTTPSADLERNWVLPRLEGTGADTFLKHVAVASHWGEWTLRYQRLPNPLPGRKMPKARRGQLRRLGRELAAMTCVQEWLAQEHVLGVVDVPELKFRVALFRAGAPRPWRLARELGAHSAYLSMGNGNMEWLDLIVNNS